MSLEDSVIKGYYLAATLRAFVLPAAVALFAAGFVGTEIETDFGSVSALEAAEYAAYTYAGLTVLQGVLLAVSVAYDPSNRVVRSEWANLLLPYFKIK